MTYAEMLKLCDIISENLTSTERKVMKLGYVFRGDMYRELHAVRIIK